MAEPAPSAPVLIDDSIHTGIETAEQLDFDPYGFRVHWIAWDSDFRKGDLRIGDVIIGEGDTRYEKAKRDQFHESAIGQYAETQLWAGRKTPDGATITLTVLRDTATVQVRGKVLAERRWHDAAGQDAFGPGGPAEMESESFDEAWTSWYDRLLELWKRALDRGWLEQSFNSRQLLARHLAEKDRADFLAAHYPGPFATTFKQDFDRVSESLSGRSYTIADADLLYRRRGDELVIQVGAAAHAAQAAFLDAHKAELIAPFPTVDPLRGDRASVTGKLAPLPPIASNAWVTEAGRPWLVSGDSQGGFYFIDGGGAALGRGFAAGRRYQKSVTPKLDEDWTITARITGVPKMLVVNGRAEVGLIAEAAALAVPDRFFVDLTTPADPAPFAGEDAAVPPTPVAVTPDTAPDAVVSAYFTTLMNDDPQTWRGFFADWRAVRDDDGTPYYYPYYPPPEATMNAEWLRARRLILGDVYAVKPVHVGVVHALFTGDEFKGAPKIDYVVVEVDHVGLFNGEYHAFKDVDENRLWVLQRRDGGAWRITDVTGI